MALDVSLAAALQGPAATVFCALEIVLPDHTLRVLDGTGVVAFGDRTFGGSDATFGILHAIESVAEQVGTEAPRVRFTFMPSTMDATVALSAPSAQGSEVSLWFGAVDPATGLVIGEPELLFIGELDAVEGAFDQNSRVLTLDVASAWDRLFDVNEGNRLNNAFHQSIWPGELGFQYVTQIQRDEPWGFDAPRPRVVADVLGGQQRPVLVGGGGGGGGGRDWGVIL